MAQYQVSEENLNKVESFFVRRVKETGSNRIEATIIDIAEGSDVALATAHKAIKELALNKYVQIIKPSSRRFPITYVYTRSIEGFDVEENSKDQIVYLKDLVFAQKKEIEILKKELQESQGKINVLENSHFAHTIE